MSSSVGLLPTRSSDRIVAVDWLRGLSVIFMIECHSLIFLHPSLEKTEGWWRVQNINGLIAPSFVFAAGFAMALVFGRITNDSAARWRRVRKALVRIAQVAGVVILLKPGMITYPIVRGAFALFRVPPESGQYLNVYLFGHHLFGVRAESWVKLDILMCIAGSLLLLLGMIVAVSRWPRATGPTAFAIAILLLAITPWSEGLVGLDESSKAMISLINPSEGSMFPLLPWAAYVFLGAGIGSLTVGKGGRSRLMIALMIMFVVSIVVAYSGVLSLIYPSEWYSWVVANHAERMWKVAAILMTLLGIETVASLESWPLNDPVSRFVGFFGRSSLSGYFVHLVLIYSFFGLRTFGRFHRECNWPQFWVVSGSVILTTMVICWGFGLLMKELKSDRKPKFDPVAAAAPLEPMPQMVSAVREPGVTDVLGTQAARSAQNSDQSPL